MNRACTNASVSAQLPSDSVVPSRLSPRPDKALPLDSRPSPDQKSRLGPTAMGERSGCVLKRNIRRSAYRLAVIVRPPRIIPASAGPPSRHGADRIPAPLRSVRLKQRPQPVGDRLRSFRLAAAPRLNGEQRRDADSRTTRPPLALWESAAVIAQALNARRANQFCRKPQLRQFIGRLIQYLYKRGIRWLEEVRADGIRRRRHALRRITQEA